MQQLLELLECPNKDNGASFAATTKKKQKQFCPLLNVTAWKLNFFCTFKHRTVSMGQDEVDTQWTSIN